MDRSKFIGFPWADPSDPTTSNYPSGSDDWAGGPTRIPAVHRFWTPGPSNAPTAQEFNDVVGRRDDALLSLLNAAGQIDALNWGDLTNWGPALNSATAVGAMAPAWHAQLGLWIVGYNTGSTFKWASSPDGKTWFLFGTSTATHLPEDMSFNPTTGAGVSIGNGDLYALAAGTTTWAPAGSWSSGGMSGAANTTGTTFFAGVHVIFTNALPSTTILCAWSATGGPFDPFTNATGTLFTVGANGGGFPLYAQSAGRLVIMSQSDGTHYTYSSDGKAWTQGTVPTLLTGEQVKGVACDGSTGTFYLLVSTSSAARIFASADGITWTLVSSPAKSMYQLAANDGTLLSIVSDTWGTHLVASADGGATWRYAGLGCHSAPLSGAIVLLSGSARLRGNRNQFIVSDAAQMTYAASKILGLPPVAA
jgi:hypothetical protein